MAIPPGQTTHAARFRTGLCGTILTIRALAGGEKLEGSTPPLVATTSTSSPASASRAVRMSLPSFWYSVEQVTSTRGFSRSSSQDGGSAGGGQEPGAAGGTDPGPSPRGGLKGWAGLLS